MAAKTVFTITQLHDDTCSLVRLASASKQPISIMDGGREIAVIANRALLRGAPRRRLLNPEFAAMMARAPGNDVQSALDEVRGDR